MPIEKIIAELSEIPETVDEPQPLFKLAFQALITMAHGRHWDLCSREFPGRQGCEGFRIDVLEQTVRR